MVNSWEPLYSGNYMKSKKANKKFDFKVFTDRSKNKSDYGWYTTKFKIDDSDLKNKGGKPTVRVCNVGHALHVWLNVEYHGNGHGSHDEKSPWSLSGPCFCVHRDRSKNKSDYGWYTTKFKIDDSDLKNKGGKPTVRVSNVGHALHVWLNGEYHGNGHGSHDEKSPWSLSGPCFCYFFCAKPSDAFPWLFSTLSNHLHITFIIHNLSLWFLRDVDITKRLDYSSAIVVLGFSLIVSILRTFDIRVEAARVMVSAPVLALVTTHVLYINFYKLDYGWNMIVCVAMGVAQLFLWGRWAASFELAFQYNRFEVNQHPIAEVIPVVLTSGQSASREEVVENIKECRSMQHCAYRSTGIPKCGPSLFENRLKPRIPLTILWWSFIRDYAEFRTSSILKKSKTKAK
ncbi:hypothetical protein F2Q70_00027224 [Brassica cretica]|uniref:Post-GPI attachment to proteins factor 3 n=1 Tax=Brassica cretica TaxID=69181 RepID=A0A8S9L950_BRACR|nr:hypothetical protein F2Q70_00027224 [Brassica cretica]